MELIPPTETFEENAVTTEDSFADFTYDDLQAFGRKLKLPVIVGRAVSADQTQAGFSVETYSFTDFCQAVSALGSQVEFLVFDESVLDEVLLSDIGIDLQRIALETETDRLLNKVTTSLRGHLNEVFAVTAYAFLKSGRVIFCRRETDLALFLSWPERLLSQEGLEAIRILR